MSVRIRFLAFSLLLATTWAHADIYRIKDKNGRVVYTDQPPAGSSSNKVTGIAVPRGKEISPQELATRKAGWEKTLKKSPAVAGSNTKLLMYATSWCGYCRKAREYMRRQGIAFSELDVEKDDKARQEHARLGGRGVPFFVMGQRTLAGFEPSGLEAFLHENRE